MRTILVTGANKGIGLAIVEAILGAHPDTRVLLGSRDQQRGEQARQGLPEPHRVDVLQLDVTDADSVAAAAQQVGALYGLVNNAGVGFGSDDVRAVLDVNLFGVHRVVEAFAPRLGAGSRVVNISSAAGPNYVAATTPERRRILLDPQIDWPTIERVAEAAIRDGEPNPYGLSKALLNAYTRLLAREHPDWVVNACTPGFIETDLTRPLAARRGVSPAELGMKPPEAGARAPLHLLFGEVGQGWYYGSDAQRSPLDRYRSPGDPPYTGP